MVVLMARARQRGNQNALKHGTYTKYAIERFEPRCAI